MKDWIGKLEKELKRESEKPPKGWHCSVTYAPIIGRAVRTARDMLERRYKAGELVRKAYLFRRNMTWFYGPK